MPGRPREAIARERLRGEYVRPELLLEPRWARREVRRPEAGALWPRCVHRSVIVRRFMDAKNLVSPSVGVIASLAGPSVGSAVSKDQWTKPRTACPWTHSVC
jgi:hypothetical protein